MGQLTVTFQGISTHFHHYVPGVPHRVVLPNATAVTFGQMQLEQTSDLREVGYFCLPHVPFLLVESGTLREPAPIVDGTLLLNAVHLRVVNAVSSAVTHDPSFEDNVRSLLEFVPGYIPSSEVVLGGRAAAYFDVDQGAFVSTPVPDPGMATRTVIAIDTIGPPVLRVTSMGREVPPFDLEFEEENASLIVGNIDLDPSAADGVTAFDFLLHYLTGRDSIPHNVTRPMPGMGEAPPPQTPETAAGAMFDLSLFLDGVRPDAEQLRQAAAFDVSDSCSDSRYP